MQSRQLSKMLCGFVLAAVLAIGPPIVFLSIPGAGFFFLLLPIWSVGVVCLLFLGFLIFGRIAYAMGVATLALAWAVSPLGTMTLMTGKVVSQAIDTNDFVLRQLNEKCATSLAPLKKASAKYNLVVLDNIDPSGEQNYNLTDSIAVVTGMRVIEIRNFGFDHHFDEAWETRAEHSSSCGGGRDSAEVWTTPRGSQRHVAPLAVDVCLRRTKIPDPSRDQTPAIVLKSSQSGALYCDATEVVERMGTAETELGRVHYDAYQQRISPELPVFQGMPKNNWLPVLVSEILQQDVSDAALLKHAVKTKK